MQTFSLEINESIIREVGERTYEIADGTPPETWAIKIKNEDGKIWFASLSVLDVTT